MCQGTSKVLGTYFLSLSLLGEVGRVFYSDPQMGAT